MNDMHMKRNLPQLYLSRDAREGRSGSMNDFNVVLKKSLMSPQKQRYIQTKLEQDTIERQRAFTTRRK